MIAQRNLCEFGTHREFVREGASVRRRLCKDVYARESADASRTGAESVAFRTITTIAHKAAKEGLGKVVGKSGWEKCTHAMMLRDKRLTTTSAMAWQTDRKTEKRQERFVRQLSTYCSEKPEKFACTLSKSEMKTVKLQHVLGRVFGPCFWAVFLGRVFGPCFWAVFLDRWISAAVWNSGRGQWPRFSLCFEWDWVPPGSENDCSDRDFSKDAWKTLDMRSKKGNQRAGIKGLVFGEKREKKRLRNELDQKRLRSGLEAAQ